MGCGASKSAVIPLGEGFDESGAPLKAPVGQSSGITNSLTSSNQLLDDVSISARRSQGLAFEVPLHDNSDEESLIKKHPPKRLQRLEDQQVTPLTHRLLEEKQLEAEQRRLQILSQRIASAKARQKLKRHMYSGNMENGEIKTNGLMIERMNQEMSTVEL